MKHWTEEVQKTGGTTTRKMYPIIRQIFSLAPWHLLSWGMLFGTTFYQSIVMVKLAYKVLPMEHFTRFQKNVFPIYFSLQTVFAILTAATYPPSSIASMFEEGAIWSAAVPLGVNIAMGALNAMIFGPKVSTLMMARYNQQTIEATRKDATVSEEMLKLNRAFSKSHAMSIHLNFIAMIATVWYGFSLASKLQFKSGKE